MHCSFELVQDIRPTIKRKQQQQQQQKQANKQKQEGTDVKNKQTNKQTNKKNNHNQNEAGVLETTYYNKPKLWLKSSQNLDLSIWESQPAGVRTGQAKIGRHVDRTVPDRGAV